MSTRSCVEVFETHYRHADNAGKRLISLYRHHDGYPAIGGDTLLHCLRMSKSVTQLAYWLLVQRYDATTYTPERQIYELTTGAKDHGDLEHTYKVWRGIDGAWHVKHGVRMSWESDTFTEVEYTEQAFAELVAAEKDSMERRAQARASSLQG